MKNKNSVTTLYEIKFIAPKHLGTYYKGKDYGK